MDPQIKESRLDEVRIFRCQGPVFATAMFKGREPRIEVRGNGNIIMDAEGVAIGWVKFTVRPSPNGRAVDLWADAIIDYESEARLMAENGELSLQLSLEADAEKESIVVTKSPTITWVPRNYALNLKPVEADWRSLFI